MLNLKENPILSDIQEYVLQMKKERGFKAEDPVQEAFLLGEEIGELFKAIRKSEGWSIDPKSKTSEVSEELADCLIYLCSIANIYNINLEEAFRAKEEINKTRKWNK